MPCGHGVVQGYNGQAMVDGKHQVVVHAEAFGEGQDNGLLGPMMDGTREQFQAIGERRDVFEKTALVADAGYHSEKNMQKVFEEGVDAYVADNGFRKRDPRFADVERYRRPVDRKQTPYHTKQYFQPSDFVLNKATGRLVCPAGNELYVKNRNFRTAKGERGISYMGWKTKCRVCELRSRCMRNARTQARQVTLFIEHAGVSGTCSKRMIAKFDSARGRFMYSRRLGIVEPVFANICHILGLNRFTLRGRIKVGTQWKLYCMVHNITKLFRYAPRFAC